MTRRGRRRRRRIEHRLPSIGHVVFVCFFVVLGAPRGLLGFWRGAGGGSGTDRRYGAGGTSTLDAPSWTWIFGRGSDVEGRGSVVDRGSRALGTSGKIEIRSKFEGDVEDDGALEEKEAV